MRICLLLAAAAGLLTSPVSAQVISEFQPNPPGADPADQSFELSGDPSTSFSGWIISIESDPGTGLGIVDRASSVSGTFDANGLLVVTVPDLENPSFTVLLTSDFTGAVGTTDVDTDDDGVADDLTAFGTIYDAIGSPDTAGDEANLYGADAGGTDFAYTGSEPELIFRSASTGDLYAVNALGTDAVFDTDANALTSADFDSDPTVAPTFGTVNPARNPVVSQSVFDGEGWRLLSAPVSGLTVGDLAGINLVQGVAAGATNAAQYPAADANLYTDYTGGGTSTDYTAPTDADDVVEPGRGFFWYWFDADAGPFAGGTSQGYELSSFVLTASGPALTTDVAETFSETADGFYMIGNPFAESLYLYTYSAVDPSDDAITSSVGTLSSSFYVYDPETSAYVALFAAQEFPGALAAWQGAFAEVTGTSGTDPVISYDYDSVEPDFPAPFYGRRAAEPGFALHLDGVLDSGASVADRSAQVRVLDDAEVGWDRHDLSELTPPNTEAALLALVGERDAEPRRQGVLSLPTALAGETTVPVAFLASGAGEFTVSWDAATLPEGWTATLRDRVTASVSDLAVAGSYAFEAEAADWTDRFEVVLASASVAEESGPEAGHWVGDVYPNPAVGEARLGVRLAAAERVTATVYDALGRAVAVAFDGDLASGTQTLRVETAAFAPGVYVVRLDGETFAASRRLVVTR